jgi:hypothetical protein
LEKLDGMPQATVTRWAHAAFTLHAGIRSACIDPVHAAIVELHRPAMDDEGMPVCTGCDADRPDLPEPVWPCRTITLLARSVLRITDVEGYLIELRDAAPFMPDAWRHP